MEYFKVKSILQSSGAACKIQIIKYHGMKEGKYGEQYEYDIKCDGNDMKWFASKYQQAKIKETGKVNFMIQRWDQAGKTGFNFLPEGDVQVLPQNVSSQPSHSEQKDDFQEKISRGASLNLAADYMIYRLNGGTHSVHKWWKELISIAESITGPQGDFVLKRDPQKPVEEDKVPETAIGDPTGCTEDPEAQGYDPTEDLPF